MTLKALKGRFRHEERRIQLPLSERPSGTQLGWLAERLGIHPRNLQADLCNGMGWPVWSVEYFKNASTGLDCHLVNDLCSHGVIPILTERGSNENNERSGFITVMAEHGLVAPMVLSACRRHKHGYLFCFAAVVAIDELEALLASRHE